MQAPIPSLKEVPVIIHLLVPFLLLQLVRHSQAFPKDHLYTQQSLCKDMVLASDHRFQTHSVRSLIQCLSDCQATEGCVSVVHEPDSRLCHLGDSVAWQNCSNTEKISGTVKMRHYEKTCKNGDEEESGRCVCQEPHHGWRCEQTLRDCGDVVHNNTHAYVINISPESSPAPFPVLCRPHLGRTYIFRNKMSQGFFNRSWEDYVNGFGDLEKDYWLGLKYIRQITLNERDYAIKFQITLTDKTKAFVRSKNFRLNTSPENYTFSLIPVTSDQGLAADCFSPLLGAAFSTYDNDNDDSALNCAQRHGFGWWFKGDNCFDLCLPLGNVNAENFLWSGILTDAFWHTDFGNATIAEVRGYFLDLSKTNEDENDD